MIKKCIGCGKTLQNTNKENIGYTPNLEKPYCMRCFRLKNYGEKNTEWIKIDDQLPIIDKVNKKDCLVFFLIDYFNINCESLNLFKKITVPKILVISKSDLIRKEVKHQKIVNWLSHVYNIKEKVLFLNNKEESINIYRAMDEKNINTAYIMGLTNTGKSTFLNSLLKSAGINKEILVSNKPNTTLDFIKFKIGDYIIYDTPGFNMWGLSEDDDNKVIKPITYQIKKPTTILIGSLIKLYFEEENSVTIYSKLSVKRIYEEESCKKVLKLKDNQDIVIPGFCYINVKKAGNIYFNGEFCEIRDNISSEE